MQNFRTKLFVYDCGSKSEKLINKAIKNYCSLKGQNLLFLAISHLHFDHVSGLPTLLETVNKVKYVFLPYLKSSTRLLFLLKALKTNTTHEWYLQFLVNPAEYLASFKKIDGIVYITHSFTEEKRKKESTEDLILTLEDDTIEEPITSNKIYVKKGGTIILNDSSKKSLWEFTFINPPVKEEDLEKFKDCLSYNEKEIFELLEIIRKSKNSLEELRSYVRKLKECYVAIANNINDTSLILYHNIGKNDYYCNIDILVEKKLGCGCKITSNINCVLQTATLLWGDINLNKILNSSTNRGKYIGKFLTEIGGFVKIALVPHHCSNYNWNLNILNYLSNAQWIVCNKDKNKANCKDILKPLKEKLHFCSEKENIIYKFTYLDIRWVRN